MDKDSREMPAVLLALVLALFASSILAEETPVPAPQPPAEKKKDSDLPRLLAALNDEPLAAFCVEDARRLPERFAQTNLSKMLNDPSYAEGSQALTEMLTEALGADFSKLWPQLSRDISGPAVLAYRPPKPDKEKKDKDEFRYVLLVVVENAESAAEIQDLWPKETDPDSLLSSITLQPVLLKDLPAEEDLPAWAKDDAWPQGEIRLRILPQRLGAALKPLLDKHTRILFNGRDILPALRQIEALEIQYCGIGLELAGEMFVEHFRLEVSDKESTFTRCVRSIREKPALWDSILAATPGGQEITIQAQTDPRALQDDLPFAGQSIERFLRGKRWTKNKSLLPQVLDPQRLAFLTGRLQGSFSVAAKAAASGELRLSVAVGMKNEDPGGLRKALLEGLQSLDAHFESLPTAGKIGASAPLGATFQGRGIFSAPVIGLSPGWAWLCSSSAAYQDLTDALKNGRTAAAAAARRKAAAQETKKPQDWSPQDVVRVEINLEKVLKLWYWVWVLSGSEGPSIGSWKVPAKLLPQPQLFTGHVGAFRAAVSRDGNRLDGRASCTIPVASVMWLSILQGASESIAQARRQAEHPRLLPIDEPKSEPLGPATQEGAKVAPENAGAVEAKTPAEEQARP